MTCRALLFASLLLTGCVHHLECHLRQDLQDKVAEALVRRFDCKITHEVAKDVSKAATVYCKAIPEIETMPDAQGDDKRGQCLYLTEQMARMIEEGTPSTWWCAGGVLDQSFDEVCDAYAEVPYVSGVTPSSR